MTALLTLDQAAELLGVSRRTINRWIARRKLSVVRLSSRSPRIRPVDLERTVEKLTHRGIL